MEYVNLGNTGLMVSRLCLGCMTLGTSEWRKWVLDERDAREVFKTALPWAARAEAGYADFFEVAAHPLYGPFVPFHADSTTAVCSTWRYSAPRVWS